MKPNKAKIFGITGGSGAGKSEVARVLASLGAGIICADSVAHAAMKRGAGPAFERIVDEFGAGVIGDDGEICRKALRGIVFADKTKLKTLEGFMHGIILEAIFDSIEKSRKSVIGIDAPLLVPSGLNRHCDHVVGVFAPLDVRIARICARDGLTYADARMRIGNQMPDGELRGHVDYSIENNGTLEELNEKVIVFYNTISAGGLRVASWG